MASPSSFGDIRASTLLEGLEEELLTKSPTNHIINYTYKFMHHNGIYHYSTFVLTPLSLVDEN